MDYSITRKDKRILIELCELSLRVQWERLEVLEDEFPESQEVIKTIKRMGKELMAKELIVDKLRTLQTQENNNDI